MFLSSIVLDNGVTSAAISAIDTVEMSDATAMMARIIASKLRHGEVIRTHPVCAYPMVAKYKGTGSTDDAENFVCTEGERSPKGDLRKEGRRYAQE